MKGVSAPVARKITINPNYLHCSPLLGLNDISYVVAEGLVLPDKEDGSIQHTVKLISENQAITIRLVTTNEIVCELMGCSEVGLRFACVGRAMCPGRHIDRTSIRLVCTYQGPGTEWLDDQSIERSDLDAERTRDKSVVQA